MYSTKLMEGWQLARGVKKPTTEGRDMDDELFCKYR